MLIVKCKTDYDKELKYICDVVFEEFFGIPVQVFANEGRVDLIEVCSNNEGKSMFMPNTLFNTSKKDWLHESSFPKTPISTLNIEGKKSEKLFKKDLPILYGSKKIDTINLDEMISDIPIDILGSIFFCITLYEEIDSNNLDQHERFDFKKSIFFKEGLHERALVNEYLEFFWIVLSTRFNLTNRKTREYQLCISHDIDHPLAFNLGIKKTIRNLIGDLINRKSITLFIKRLIGLMLPASIKNNFDPNYNFDFLMDVSEENNKKSSFYFIPINGNGNIDGHYSLNSPFFLETLKKINNRGHFIGFHPGYFSFCDFEETKSQFDKLKLACKNANVNQDDFGGRHHYLRWRNPDSWQIWNDIGATYDSSVGYSGTSGFRGACCYAYPAFNLKTRERLKLIEKPLVVMDVNVLPTGSFIEIQEKVTSFANIVRFFGGELTLLYHNNYIISKSEKKHYRELIKKIA